jgi:hypothetical protein
MNKNITSIVFLFFVIFVALMFGQDIEGFAVIDQTDGTGSSGITGHGTYFTKETGTGTNAVSVFSAMKEFSNDINVVANGADKTDLTQCLNDATKNNADKSMCVTRYNTLMNMPSGFWTDATGSYKKLLSAATRNPTLKQSQTTHATTQANISDKNAINKALQQELDRKMSDMLDDKTGMKLESAAKQNSTMYVNIALTVLATTALYYIFVKI